jgi:hypothetical protein
VLPEFVQHVFEIKIGMFASLDAFKAQQFDPTRWLFGYAKLTGFFLSIFAAARFWWCREHGGHWWSLCDLAWGRLLIGLVLFGGVPMLPELFKDQISRPVYLAAVTILTIATLPMLFMLLAGLFGDRETPAQVIWRRSWGWIVLTAGLTIVAFAPAAILHQWDHRGRTDSTRGLCGR